MDVWVCAFLGNQGHSMSSQRAERLGRVLFHGPQDICSLSFAHLLSFFHWTTNAPLPWGVVIRGWREECGASTCFSLTQDLVTHLTVNLIPSLSILSPGREGVAKTRYRAPDVAWWRQGRIRWAQWQILGRSCTGHSVASLSSLIYVYMCLMPLSYGLMCHLSSQWVFLLFPVTIHFQQALFSTPLFLI